MPSALVFYHYFYPDDVVSATLLAELSEGLARRGWSVTAMPCNRGCHDDTKSYPSREQWRGVDIRRVWRPAWRQASHLARFLNALWMLAAWSLAAFRSHPPDVLLIGTDPILSVAVARFWRLVRPRVRIAHWCFDLYPQAAAAEGLLRQGSICYRLFAWIARQGYQACDLIVDIGSCMREQLAACAPAKATTTLTPWALCEPAYPQLHSLPYRQKHFGAAQLALLYSGSFGRAHSHTLTMALARTLRAAPIQFVYSVRGNRAALLKEDITSADGNISLMDSVSPDLLATHLAACDVHIVSLHQDWNGLVVPSKFFGALAIGRPVLFEGSEKSAVSQWIRQHQVGWVLTEANLPEIAQQLRDLAARPWEVQSLFERCHRVYREYFSKDSICSSWDNHLRALLNAPSLPAEELQAVPQRKAASAAR